MCSTNRSERDLPVTRARHLRGRVVDNLLDGSLLKILGPLVRLTYPPATLNNCNQTKSPHKFVHAALSQQCVDRVANFLHNRDKKELPNMLTECSPACCCTCSSASHAGTGVLNSSDRHHTQHGTAQNLENIHNAQSRPRTFVLPILQQCGSTWSLCQTHWPDTERQVVHPSPFDKFWRSATTDSARLAPKESSATHTLAPLPSLQQAQRPAFFQS